MAFLERNLFRMVNPYSKKLKWGKIGAEETETGTSTNGIKLRSLLGVFLVFLAVGNDVHFMARVG